MRRSQSDIDDRLAELTLDRLDSDIGLPSILDVTGASDAAIASARLAPVITFERLECAVPPRESARADLTLPAAIAARVHAAVNANPATSLVLTQLIRATSHLPIEDALAMESIAYSALQHGAEYRTWLSLRAPSSPEHSDAPRVIVTEAAEHVTVTLNRPEHGNALDAQARHELAVVFSALLHRDDPIVLDGAGTHFCTGGDLDEFSLPLDPMATHGIRSRLTLAATIARLGSRLRARVHGGVIGAGLELSSFAAHVSSHRGARFRLPEVRMGLIPGAGGTVSVTRRIGANRALILMLTGSVLRASEALEWGLIDEVRD